MVIVFVNIAQEQTQTVWVVPMRGKKTFSDQNYIRGLSDELKPLNTAEDLVKVGVANSVKTLSNKRNRGVGPDFIRIAGAGIRYPKDAVLAWIEKSSVYVKCNGHLS